MINHKVITNHCQVSTFDMKFNFCLQEPNQQSLSFPSVTKRYQVPIMLLNYHWKNKVKGSTHFGKNLC